MLTGAGLPKEFQAEDLNTSSYLINRSPSTTIGFITPMERWTGKVPNLMKLKTFGYTAYAHIRPNNLWARALKFIFLGHLDGVKGYKFWYITMSRDEVFHESDCPFLPKKEINSNDVVKIQILNHYVVEVGSQMMEHKEEAGDEVQQGKV